MADIVWADVLTVAPELATGVSAGFQTLIVAYVNEVVQASEFGGAASTTYTMARAYLAAHYAYLHKQAGSGGIGPVVSKSEGGVSISYANMMSSDGSILGSSSYGQTFRSLVSRSPARAGFLT